MTDWAAVFLFAVFVAGCFAAGWTLNIFEKRGRKA